jgi:hypothetical protein
MLEGREHGTLAARRRPLAQVATALVNRNAAIASARVRVRPRRTAGGRVAVKASRTRRSNAAEVQTSVRKQIANLTDPFNLTARIDVRRTERVS